MQIIDAVLFDYGGVLTGPVKHSIASWLAADAIEPKSFSRRVLRPDFVTSGLILHMTNGLTERPIGAKK
jgi:hypothetical protein